MNPKSATHTEICGLCFFFWFHDIKAGLKDQEKFIALKKKAFLNIQIRVVDEQPLKQYNP